MRDIRPEPHSFWNPGTRLFEVAVLRRKGPDLIIKNLPLHTADELREKIAAALKSHRQDCH
jgi:hypothetical protein